MEIDGYNWDLGLGVGIKGAGRESGEGIKKLPRVGRGTRDNRDEKVRRKRAVEGIHIQSRLALLKIIV